MIDIDIILLFTLVPLTMVYDNIVITYDEHCSCGYDACSEIPRIPSGKLTVCFWKIAMFAI